MNVSLLNYWDWLLAPLYIFITVVIASGIKDRYIKKNPIYKYFLSGLIVKIIGAISVCLVYAYYYKTGGDTLSYYSSAIAFVNLLFQSPVDFLHVWFSAPTRGNYFFFNANTGFPFFYNQQYELTVVKLIVPLELVAFKSYITSSVLMAAVSYTGVWKLYQMFCEIYPSLYKKFAIAILFIPSVVFWGSGILKDSWTLAGAGWFCFSFYRIFINRKNIIFNILCILISSFILISIKPYIFIALLPGCLVLGTWNQILSIKNLFLKFLFIPFILSAGIGGGIFVWGIVSAGLGQYSSVDSMIKKAVDSSEDLKQEYYHGNSFDIGSYDPSLSGMMSKFPIAVFTGLFRPFLWESKNIVMILSGIENLITLFFAFYVFLRKPISNLRNLFSKPIVLFSLIFAIFFSFSVAISTSNFGALVRLRIPQIPFLLSGLVILNFWKEEKKINKT